MTIQTDTGEIRDLPASARPGASSRRALLRAQGREVGVTPEMLVAPAEQVSRDRSRSLPSATHRALPLHAYCSHPGVTTASHCERRPIDREHTVAEVAEHSLGATAPRWLLKVMTSASERAF